MHKNNTLLHILDFLVQQTQGMLLLAGYGWLLDVPVDLSENLTSENSAFIFSKKFNV